MKKAYNPYAKSLDGLILKNSESEREQRNWRKETDPCVFGWDRASSDGLFWKTQKVGKFFLVGAVLWQSKIFSVSNSIY